MVSNRCGRRCVGHLHYHRRRHRECASVVTTVQSVPTDVPGTRRSTPHGSHIFSARASSDSSRKEAAVMPAILGPGSVSLETCASDAQARIYLESSLSPGGVSFCKRTRPAFSKRLSEKLRVIERAAPGVRQPCRHGDHHSARQTGCVQPTLTPPADRRRTVAEQPSGAPSGGGRSRAFRRRSAACDDGRGAGIATCTTRKPHSTMFSDRLLRSVLCPLHGLEVVARDARLLLLRGR